MSSTTSESYCNHLRGQLKEWERAFRSRNGRFPKQPDFEALEGDESARGRLVHAAYLALNRATGDSFTSSLATRESTRGTVIIGGPRQRAVERKNAEALGHTQRFRRSGGGIGVSGSRQSSKPVSQHEVIMERLRAKVQPRPGSSLGAPLLASGMAGKRINAVLAAGDGHRRSGDGEAATQSRLKGRSANGAGISVSRRARAMGMSATAAKNQAAAATEPEASVSASLVCRRKSDNGAPCSSGSSFAKIAGKILGVNASGGDGGRCLERSRRDETRSLGAAELNQHKSCRTGEVQTLLPPGAASESSQDRSASAVAFVDESFLALDEDVGGSDTAARMKTSNSQDCDGEQRWRPATQKERHHQSPPPLRSEGELTPERRATRRVGGAARGIRGATTGASSFNTLASTRKEEGGKGGNIKASSLSGGRSSAGAPMAYSSAGAKGFSPDFGLRPDVDDMAATAADEAGFAVAMMSILQPSESDGLCSAAGAADTAARAAAPAAAGDAGAGKERREKVRRRASGGSSLRLATNIVNTVGGGGGSGVGTTFPPPGFSLSSSTASSITPAIAPQSRLKDGNPITAAKAAKSRAAITETICGPGLVAASSSSASGSRRTGGGGAGNEGDWHLRASRAVGRVREEAEEEASKAKAAVAAMWKGVDRAGAHASESFGSDVPHIRGMGNSASDGAAAGLDAVAPSRTSPSSPSPGKDAAPRGAQRVAPANLSAGRISDSDDDGRDSDWSINGGGGGGGGGDESSDLRGKDQARGREPGSSLGATASARAATSKTVAAEAARPRPAGGKKQPAKKTTEVSDNFVRADLKSRGSSRFKRKGSGRSKARGGSGGRSFGGGRGGGGGRWGGRGDRGFGGSSKWGGGGRGTEDPVTGERRGAPRDRPLSCGAAKNRAGLDVLDQCLDALAVVTGDSSGAAGDSGCEEWRDSRPFQRPKNAREEEELFLRLAPRCPQHQRGGKLLTVRKTGLNKGRKFYACSLPRGEGCDFFMWAEDNPALVLAELTLEETGDEWRQRKTTLLSKSLAKLPVTELKKELSKLRLSRGGKKDDLIKRLVDHAAAELESSASSYVQLSSSPPKKRIGNKPATKNGVASAAQAWSSGGKRDEGDAGLGESSWGRGVEGGDDGSVSEGADDDDDDDDDDDGDDDGDDSGSEFEFAFTESVQPAAAAAAVLPGEAETTANAAVDPSLPSLIPATEIGADPGQCAALDEPGQGEGSSGVGGGRWRSGSGKSIAPADAASAEEAATGLSDSSGGVDGQHACVKTLRKERVRRSIFVEDVDVEAGRREEDEEEDEGPAWASLVNSDEDEQEELEKEEVEEEEVEEEEAEEITGDEDEDEAEEKGEGRGGSGRSVGGDSAGEGDGGDPDDDSAWSDEDERADRANRRRRAERNKRRKLADGGVSRRHRKSGGTRAAEIATGSGGSNGSSSGSSTDENDLSKGPVRKYSKRKRQEGIKRDSDEVGDGCNDDANGDGNDRDLPLTPVSALRRVFGHKTFREGQEWGIDRAMKGLPSLLVLATGTGKSLTYQLPALLLPGITVVVSPLVSLMEDQMAKLPPQLPGASLSGSHGGLREVAGTVRDLKAGRVKVLFLSPEKLCSPSFRRLASTPGALPPVSLLCVDEAHCVSQWSHNFRPSYLRLGQTLDLLCPRGVLALTATASKAVIGDICDTLRIPLMEGVRVGSWDRPNLDVRVLRTSSDDDKRSRLSRLLQEAPLDKGSVVVYVWRQATAEAVCSLLQGDGHDAVAYHGGMEAGARQKAQSAFIRGRARVVVATVAFGLGVDMRDIRGVVHFDMPKSIENYVQEIGRAGRDGRSALCCVLLCSKDFVTHHSLSHSKGLELVQVRGLLRSIMADAPQGKNDETLGEDKAAGARDQYDDAHGDGGAAVAAAAGFQKAISVVDLESRLDVGGEVAETVLSMLEAQPYRLLKLHAVMDDHLVVCFRKRRPSVLAVGEPVIGLLLALGTIEGISSSGKGYSYGHGSAKISLVRLAEALGWATTAVVRELRRLQFMGEVEYSLSQRSFHVTLLKSLSAPALEEVSQSLHRTLSRAEASEAEKVEAVYLALAAEAAESGEGSGETSSSASSSSLRNLSGKKRAREGYTASAAAASGSCSEGCVGVGEAEGCGVNHSGSRSSGGRVAARQQSLLHATITRYFDEGGGVTFTSDHSGITSNGSGGTPLGATGGRVVSGGRGAVGNHGRETMMVEGEGDASPPAPSPAAAAAAAARREEEEAKCRVEALPHKPLDGSACEVLVRDASVLITDPSFQGCLSASFDDGYGGGSGGGGGLGFFNVATGGTAAVGGGGVTGGRGMAPHSWLLKDVPMLARAVARVFHGIGSVSFPAAKWRDSAFWARYRQHSFREVKSKLEIVFGARHL